MLFCFVSCLMCLGIGVMFSWPSNTLKFSETKTINLNRIRTDTEEILFDFLPLIGAVISIPVAGICLDKLGRKYCALISSALCVLSWTIIAFSNKVEIVLTALFISGLSGAMFIIAPIYISEICRGYVRDALTAGCVVLYELGMLIADILGAYLDYQTMVYLSLLMSAVGTFCICTLEESPVYLMAKGMETEAAKSIAFYTGTKSNTSEVIKEMTWIRQSFISEMTTLDLTNGDENSEPLETPFGNLLKTLKLIKRSRSTRQALFVTAILVSVCMFQGVIAVQSYSDCLYEAAFPNLPPLFFYIIMTIMSLFVTFLSTYIIERTGIRPLMIYASFTTGIVCILIGTQVHMNWGPNSFATIFMFTFTITHTLGAGTVPQIFMCEAFLPEVKCIIIVFAVEWLCLSSLIIEFIYYMLLNLDKDVGLANMFYLSAVNSFLSIVFCVLYLPETRGLSLNEIQAVLVENRRLNLRNMIFSKKKVVK